MRPKTADIDTLMAPLIALLWKREFVTRDCYQRDPAEETAWRQA
jgi:hypothetical protein